MKPWATLVVAMIATFQCSVLAHEDPYSAILNGANETPSNASPATATVSLILDLDVFTMHLQVNFANLQGTVTAAHIHAGTATPFAGVALIATQLPALPGFPLGITSGSYEMTIDLLQQSSYNPDYFSANGGTVPQVSAAFYNGLKEGRNYFEIETTAFNVAKFGVSSRRYRNHRVPCSLFWAQS